MIIISHQLMAIRAPIRRQQHQTQENKLEEKTGMVAVKERPMLFSAPMVRALLDGSKTQTRRVAKFKSRVAGCNLAFSAMRVGHYMTGRPGAGFVLHSGSGDRTFPLICPYGQPGDRLWVRETYADIGCRLTYRADEDDGAHCKVKKWMPSIHMFRSDSRIQLEIVSVRVERLSDCSDADALAEGVAIDRAGGHFIDEPDGRHASPVGASAVEAFKSLWESISGAGSWAANPWVWVVEFKRVVP